jgi:hypothetical protein
MTVVQRLVPAEKWQVSLRQSLHPEEPMGTGCHSKGPNWVHSEEVISEPRDPSDQKWGTKTGSAKKEWWVTSSGFYPQWCSAACPTQSLARVQMSGCAGVHPWSDEMLTVENGWEAKTAATCLYLLWRSPSLAHSPPWDLHSCSMWRTPSFVQIKGCGRTPTVHLLGAFFYPVTTLPPVPSHCKCLRQLLSCVSLARL